MIKDIYPDYKDSVEFYAVGWEPFVELSDLVSFKNKQGHPWPVALAPPTLFPQYNVLQHSTKVAIDRDGVIVFREGYGVNVSDTSWRNLFQELSHT